MVMTTYQNDLEFSLLRTFLAIVRYGTMRRAATAVCRTQPAVSQQMFRLEKIIGQKVFSRTRGGVKLTHHGEMLVPYANHALELNDEALARLREESASGPLHPYDPNLTTAALALLPIMHSTQAK
jgi:DNA-binding transcriptional LysR family regulator